MSFIGNRRMAVVAALAVMAASMGVVLVRSGTPSALSNEPAGKNPPSGYGPAFEAEVKKVGQITPQEFSKRYQLKADYQGHISWDPTTAKFFDKVMLDPNDPGAKVRARGQMAKLFAQSNPKDKDGTPLLTAKGMYDFRLNEAELALFKKNGFVVSERHGSSSSAAMYYRIYGRDLPVFITCDSILDAWHRSYDTILGEVEAVLLAPTLETILAGMAAQIPDAEKQYGAGALKDSLRDADFFLAVARALLAGQSKGTRLNQDARALAALKAAQDLQLEKYNLFGRVRDVDFSQFKPRGHYEKSGALQRYFRAMMWCGRIDLRIAGNPEFASSRELGGAIVLHDLLRRSGRFETWQQLDAVLQTFVGKTDSMTFAQMGTFLAKADIDSPAKVQSMDQLTALQKEIMTGKFGLQQICGDAFYVHGSDPAKFELPRSFTVLGQKFVVDSWAFSKVVYDDVFWKGEKVMRRVPSCLDVAFAVLANDHIVPDLSAHLQDPAGRKFRDGLNYQHNLAAVRNVVDSLKPALWEENLYTSWLGCLRQLSKPTTDAKYPEAMRTHAWAMKTLNAQLASWTQLRHDTVLYAKQSYTMGIACYYPAGFVEPVPEFWTGMEQMAKRGADLLAKTPLGGQHQCVGFLSNFAKTMGVLKGIAVKELAQQELTMDETTFLENVVEINRGCGGPPSFSGWYPGLLYDGRKKAMRWDALVADVHTDVPSPVVGDPGCVLHQGVGNIDLLIVAIDNGKDRMVYAGPVLSHYEFEMPGVTRKSDSEWQKDINQGKLPPRPEWTRSYLVPGVNPAAQGYKVE
jgi:hypothetical protein